MSNKQAILNLKSLNPMEVISRNLLMADLVTINPELIAQIMPDICVQAQYPTGNYKDGVPETQIRTELDWYKIVFLINTPKLEFLLSHFQRKDKIITPEDKETMAANAKDIINTLAGNSNPTKAIKKNED